MKTILIVLMMAVTIMIAPISASALFYTDRTAWETAVGSFAYVDLPGNPGDTLLAFSTSIALPDGVGVFKFGVPLQRVNLGNGWTTWSPGTPTGTELLNANVADSNGNYTANFTFYADGMSVGPVSVFGYEMAPLDYALTLWGVLNIYNYLNPWHEQYLKVLETDGAGFFGWVGEPITQFSVISYDGSGGHAMGRFVQGIPAPVPEPATLILLGAGLAGVGLVRRKLKT